MGIQQANAGLNHLIPQSIYVQVILLCGINGIAMMQEEGLKAA